MVEKRCFFSQPKDVIIIYSGTRFDYDANYILRDKLKYNTLGICVGKVVITS